MNLGWSNHEIILLHEIYGKVSKSELLDRFPNRTRKAIGQIALKQGLTRSKLENNIKFLLEENPVSYYWLGFLLADGHFAKDRIKLALASKDESHMQLYCNFFKLRYHHYTTKTNHKTVQSVACDKLSVEKIKHKFNISNQKTYYPPDIDSIQDTSLFLSLFAGYVDGDGSISYKNAKDQRCSLQFTVHPNWLNILDGFKERLTKIFNEKLPSPFICIDKRTNKEYAHWNMSNNKFLWKLKNEISQFELPLMNRKWDKINNRFGEQIS